MKKQTIAVQHTCGWEHILDEHEDGLLRADLDPLADDVHELTHCEISWHQISAGHSHVHSSELTATHAGLLVPTTQNSVGERAYFFLSMSGMSLFSAFSTMTFAQQAQHHG